MYSGVCGQQEEFCGVKILMHKLSFVDVSDTLSDAEHLPLYRWSAADFRAKNGLRKDSSPTLLCALGGFHQDSQCLILGTDLSTLTGSVWL